MNELQQVLLIFAVVVIAGVYLLSRGRQSESKKNPQADSKTTQATAETVEHRIDAEMQVDNFQMEQNKASKALNELGEAHIPVSETTTKRVSKEPEEVVVEEIPEAAASTEKSVKIETNERVHESGEIASNDDTVHPNQGRLFFGEEFDEPLNQPPESQPQEATTKQAEDLASESEMLTQTEEQIDTEAPGQKNGKHHVLIVDDPGMTGELDSEHYTPDHEKPSFGIPEDTRSEKPKPVSSTNKEPEVFVLLVMSTGQEFAMSSVNQALLGVGLTLSEQAIFVKKDNMGNPFIKVANLLEPGTFPVEGIDGYSTPGVAMILELPTTVRAPAAMHELIMMGRKVSQRLNARLYNMERQLIKESDLQSMRDAALDYESEPL